MLSLLQRVIALERKLCRIQNGTTIIGGGSGGSAPVLTRDLTVQQGPGGYVGGSNTGEFFPAGTLIEDVIRDIEIRSVVTEYNLPQYTLSVGVNIGGNYESGSIINPLFSSFFIQNDAGIKIGEILTRNVSTISNVIPFTDTAYQIPDGLTTYQAQASYAQGPVKNNNLGVPDPIGRIEAGTINSNTILYRGYRNAFYQAITGAIPTTSAEVRALSDTLLNPAGIDFLINIPIGTVHVVFAVPASLNLQYVQYLELSNTDVKANFDMTIVSVAGASGYVPMGYKVYSYTPVEPFPTVANYRVKVN